MMHPRFFTNRSRRGLACAALVCAICALALLPQAKVHAEPVDRWVSPTGSNEGDCSNEAAPCQSINFALMVSNKIGDTIHLGPGTYTEPATTEIGKSVSIVGTGRTQPALTTIVSGGLTRRVFSIKSNTSVTIADLIITDGRIAADGDDDPAESGAGIYNLGTLLLENVEVANNAVVLPDGQSTGYYTLGDSGGGIANHGSGRITIANSVIRSNQAYAGGGIYTTASDGWVTLDNTTLASNSAIYTGGGVYASAGQVTIRRSEVRSNLTEQAGGAGITTSVRLTIEDSAIYQNRATQAEALGAYGAGIWAKDVGASYASASLVPVIRLTNVTVSDNSIHGVNTSVVPQGGGLYAALPTHLNHCTFADNEAGDGAAFVLKLFLYQSTTPMASTIRNSLFTGATPAAGSFCKAYETFVSGGHNLFGNPGCFSEVAVGDLLNRDPLLAPLAYNGSRTINHALQVGSPAIDAAEEEVDTHTDQRGFFYVDGDLDGAVAPDIGAYEYVPPPRVFLPFAIR